MDWSSKKNKRKIERYKFMSYIICSTIFTPIICVFINSYIEGNIPLIPMVLILGLCIPAFCLSLVGISKLFKWKIEKDRRKRVNRFR